MAENKEGLAIEPSKKERAGDRKRREIREIDQEKEAFFGEIEGLSKKLYAASEELKGFFVYGDNEERAGELYPLIGKEEAEKLISRFSFGSSEETESQLANRFNIDELIKAYEGVAVNKDIIDLLKTRRKAEQDLADLREKKFVLWKKKKIAKLENVISELKKEILKQADDNDMATSDYREIVTFISEKAKDYLRRANMKTKKTKKVEVGELKERFPFFKIRLIGSDHYGYYSGDERPELIKKGIDFVEFFKWYNENEKSFGSN